MIHIDQMNKVEQPSQERVCLVEIKPMTKWHWPSASNRESQRWLCKTYKSIIWDTSEKQRNEFDTLFS